MAFLIDTATGKPVQVPDDQVETRIAAGEVRYPEGARVVQEGEFGSQLVASPGEFGEGYTPVDTASQIEFGNELEFGDSPITAGALGLLRGASIGGTDIIAEKLGLGYEVDQYAQRNRGVSTATELVGAIAPALLPGGQFTAAGALARGATGIARAGANASRLARVSRAAVAGGLEGGAVGFGMSLGEQVRRGEDLSAAAAQALDDGLMGAAFGAVAGGALDIGGQAFARVREPLVQRRIARQVLDEVDVQVGSLRDEVLGVVDAQAEVARRSAAVNAAEAELVAMRKSGATFDDLAAKEGALAELQAAHRSAKKAATPQAVEKARKAMLAQADDARRAMAAELPTTIAATRGAADHVRSFAKLTADRGGFVNRATVEAAKQTDAALKKFDDLFTKSIEGSTSGGGLTKYKITGQKAGGVAKLENAGAQQDLIAAFTANPVAARQAVRELDAAGLNLARALIDEGAVTLNIPQGARGITEALFDESFQGFDEIAKRAAQYTETAVAGKLDDLGDEAAKGIAATQEEVARARQEIRAMRKDLSAQAKQEGAIDKARQYLRKGEERLAEREALLQNAEQGKAWADELEDLAKKAGILDKTGISKADLAMAAIELGDVEEFEWLARLHFLSSIMGKSAVRGSFGRVAAKGVDMATGLAAGATGRLPGGRALAAAIDMTGRGAAQKLRGIAKAQKRVVRPGEARAVFEERLGKAMQSLKTKTKVARKAAIVAPHTTLAKAQFANIDHGDNYKGLDKTTAEFEKRAAELDSLMGNAEGLPDYASERLGRNVDAAPDVMAGVSQGVSQALQYLHSILPPKRSVGGNTVARHSAPSEIRSWTRSLRYTLNPATVSEDMAAGRLTPEGPAALKGAYPALYNRVRLRLIDEVADDVTGETFPRATRLYLGRHFELPQLDGRLRPQFLAAMQATAGPAQPQPPPQRNLQLSSNAPSESARQAARG